MMSLQCKAIPWMWALALSVLALAPQQARGVQGVVEVFLEEGWNLVSLPLEPDEPAVGAVFASLIADQSLQRVYGYDGAAGQWQIFLPTYVDPLLPQCVNSLGEVHAGRGYWLQVSQASSFELWGSAVQPSLSISDGWNLVGPSLPEARTWDMFMGGFEPSLQWLWTSDFGYHGLNFATSPPTGDLLWLQPARAVWLQTKPGISFVLDPARAERVFPFSPSSDYAFVSPGGAGTASAAWDYRYSEFTFESAGFDIDRPPLACWGPEDTDAWDPAGQLSRDPDGFLGADGRIDPPVSGRFKMLINIGSPVIGLAEGSGYTMAIGGGNMFLVANRPESVPAAPVPQTVMVRALAMPVLGDKQTESVHGTP